MARNDRQDALPAKAAANTATRPLRPGRPGTIPFDRGAVRPDPSLAGRLPPQDWLRLGVLPWRRLGGATVVLTDRPRQGRTAVSWLESLFGPIRFAVCDRATLRDALIEVAGPELVARAETRVRAAESCRGLTAGRRTAWSLLAALAAAAVSLTSPATLLTALMGLVLLTLVATTLLKLAALLATLRAGPPVGEMTTDMPDILPLISLLVPLYRETEIAAHLLQRLEALDYPPDRLDLCLILEADDATTAATLAEAALPPYAQIVTVPEGTLRTKPRALNFALDFARGSIIGIYDAEDAPAPDQLRLVAARFAKAGPRTACLQGSLDYYNTSANWLARCFTLEYAGWFRVVLPGLVRLGLVVPLGGTTLFLRRAAIEAVGGWDAHNVTEDADLGIRLARHGYATEMIGTVTQEEANARAWPWVRQRTRWLKGYAATWAVHSRRPSRLVRDLGLWRAAGLQVLLLGTLTQFLLAPVLWGIWWLAADADAGAGTAGRGALLAITVLALAVDAAVLTLGAVRAGKGRLCVWIPTTLLYFPLATVAAWRALSELLVRPFYWDKTTHGQSLPQWSVPNPPGRHPA
ncbi:glycosyltransferase family 2 protein [Wenxinia marina]|uniref:Glycosyltransferase, probably involved in cell wall biogenesis n=2 Tax=Wenxinia TaxID=653686 RepID=A0A0D0NLT5_9RHOB|nr:glycosyltransferase family 2 protein [Wenxinia marina]KIQ69215.1 Glycosyltransferase, probably involved in cell wall biogenesis [Wenxinia marina DSM 24838]GGL71200.1 glycosyl transferase [Wenxinia marina]